MDVSRRRIPITGLSLALILGVGSLGGCTGWVTDTASSGAAPESTSAAPEPEAKSLLSDEESAAVTVDADLAYREVDGQKLTLDVCRAEGAAAPQAAVVLIHGGGFRAGDKGTPQWEEICRWLADAGYVAVNLNYRLAPAHPFPAAVEDVQAGVEWTRTHAQTYGIDPDRVGVLGGSAGANLAQMLGTLGEGATTQGSRVDSVVSLSGPADLTVRALQIGEPDDRQIRLVLDYLGCTRIEDCPAAEAASPITHVDPTDPPFLLVHSEQERMPVEQAQVLADALTQAGATPELLIQPGSAHATRLLADRSVRDAVLAFLQRTLG